MSVWQGATCHVGLVEGDLSRRFGRGRRVTSVWQGDDLSRRFGKGATCHVGLVRGRPVTSVWQGATCHVGLGGGDH